MVMKLGPHKIRVNSVSSIVVLTARARKSSPIPALLEGEGPPPTEEDCRSGRQRVSGATWGAQLSYPDRSPPPQRWRKWSPASFSCSGTAAPPQRLGHPPVRRLPSHLEPRTLPRPRPTLKAATPRSQSSPRRVHDPARTPLLLQLPLQPRPTSPDPAPPNHAHSQAPNGPTPAQAPPCPDFTFDHPGSHPGPTYS
ncbi:hypothetical protein P7K49_012147 [Saguinus oedipus]|uniref:Uncharacterized protein n=1 Tax=Saguinus oedipus TaxID=9490 RepID=A0ABQ9VSP5_SAGOE|nr:hypothetical protein P7K49_012147 [Saguinus oedipus]